MHREYMLHFAPACPCNAMPGILRLPGRKIPTRFVAVVLVPAQGAIGANRVDDPLAAPDDMPHVLPAASHDFMPRVLRFPGLETAAPKVTMMPEPSQLTSRCNGINDAVSSGEDVKHVPPASANDAVARVLRFPCLQTAPVGIAI